MNLIPYNQLSSLSDKELFNYCRELGMVARKWQRQFIAILPEVEKRRLYRRFGYHSIFEFAAKLGGVSNGVVTRILQIHKLLSDKPRMMALLPNVGLGKLKTVAYIANKDTDEFWANKVRTMTKTALETYVRDIKKQQTVPGDTMKSNNNPSFSLTDGSDCEQEIESNLLIVADMSSSGVNSGLFARPERVNLSVPLAPKTKLELEKHKIGLEKKLGEPLSWDQYIRRLLKGFEQAGQPKRQIKRAVIGKGSTKTGGPKKSATTRHIPARIRAKIDAKYNGRCAFPGCSKPASAMHHPGRFALTRSHENIKPLCKAHHQIAHHGLIENEQGDAGKWRVSLIPVSDWYKSCVDKKVINRLKEK